MYLYIVFVVVSQFNFQTVAQIKKRIKLELLGLLLYSLHAPTAGPTPLFGNN